jgi:sugar phosphate isomerase/epimerase
MDDLPAPEERFARIKKAGFDGVELDIPLDMDACVRARAALDDLGLEVVAQQWRTRGRTPEEHMVSFEAQYQRAMALNPLFLNSHTGCDHFEFEANLAIFDHAEGLAAAKGLAVFHETHRGRALFSAPAALRYLSVRPNLRLTADFSHWCCVHESLLEDQETAVGRAIQNSHAIHARVGYAEGPQITDPRDGLWETNLKAHLGWWKRIAACRSVEGSPFLTICPEFGPPPYMVLLPQTKQPIANQWDVNCYMREWLMDRLP